MTNCYPAADATDGVRRFTAEYLETTRRGMWADSRAALADLKLEGTGSALDIGAGTGELTRVLREDSPGRVVAVDADRSLLQRVDPPRVLGDAGRLPFADDAVELSVCQALLVNLPDTAAALAEFVRVASNRVGAIEPDNGAVTVESTVPEESELASEARRRYLQGVSSDPTLGGARELFERAGLTDVTVRRYDHRLTVAPPYSETALESARRKATGSGLDDRRATMLAGDTTLAEFDRLRERWRAMGRAVIGQMRREEYRYRETIPFYVTAGRV